MYSDSVAESRSYTRTIALSDRPLRQSEGGNNQTDEIKKKVSPWLDNDHTRKGTKTTHVGSAPMRKERSSFQTGLSELKMVRVSFSVRSRPLTTVTVTCSDGADFTISLNDGANFGNGPVSTERAMKSANNSYVSYELYSDSGRSAGDVWTSSDDVAFEGTGASQDIDIFGRIPAQTPTIDSNDTFNATGMSLSDTVTVTLEY